MVKLFTRTIAVLAAVSAGVVPVAMAQSKGSLNPTAGSHEMKMDKESRMVEGKIKQVDAKGARVTLEDGTTLAIPAWVSVPRGQLKPGTSIVAEYEEQGGQKIATSLKIKG